MATTPTAPGSHPDGDHRADNMFELVTRAANVAYYEWRPESDELRFSPALLEMFGYDPTQFTTPISVANVHPDDLPGFRAGMAAYIKGTSERAEMTYRWCTASGDYLWVRDQKLVQRDPTGRVTRMIGVVSDITEARQREADLRAALEQQTATAAILQVINANPGNLVPVFDALLEKAMRLCGAAFGMLFTYDGAQFTTVAARGVPAAYAAFRAAQAPSMRGVYREIVETKRPIHVLDAREAEEYRNGQANARALADLGGGRTVLRVPLLKDGSVIGVVVIYRQEVRAFADTHIALLENFAAQAVIAMENARLITEQREALEQQTATAEVLGVINASPGNLAPVFDAMLEKAMRLCRAAFGSLYTYDGKHFHSAAQRGVPAAYAAFRAANPPKLDEGGPFAKQIRAKQAAHVMDLQADDSYQTGPPGIRALVDLGGVRTILTVPLLQEGILRGIITIFRQEVRAFTDKQISLLQNFAAQAVIAMENARLITEQREALEQQTATAEVLGVINASPGNLAPVFDAMLEKAMRLCGVAFGSLNTWDGELVRNVANRGVPPALAEWQDRNPIRKAGAAALRSIETKRSQQLLDTMEEDGYKSGQSAPRAVVDLGGARTSLFVPLIKEESTLGFLHLFRQEVRAFSEKEIALLENFAAQAVIAMENARLITEQREALEQQTATVEILGVINASPGNLAPVFDALLEKAMRLCGAAFGSLYTYDGKDLRSAAQRGVPAAFAAFRAKTPPVPRPGNIFGRMLATKAPTQVLDTKQEPDYQSGLAGSAVTTLGGARSIVGVPLMKDGTVLGFISIYTPTH